MAILVVGSFVLAGWIAWRLIRAGREREAAVARPQQERLRVQREQYAAERRVQALAQLAFQQLLEQARLADDGTTPATAPPRKTSDLGLRRTL